MKNASFLLFGLIIGGLLVFGAIKYGESRNNNNKSNEVTVSGGEQNGASNDDNKSASTSFGQSPLLGDKEKAKVAIVEFSDYECPFCQRFDSQTFDQIKTTYVDTNKAVFVYRNFPLDFHEPAATIDANAVLCANDLGGAQKYYEFGHLVYANTGLNGKGMTKDKFVELAKGLGLDGAAFSTCFDGNNFADQIKADRSDGVKAGVDGTPYFVIGAFDQDGSVTGEKVSGALPFNSFKTIIDKYLEE